MSQQPIRRKPVPSRQEQSAERENPLQPGWEKELTNRFRLALSTERRTQLSRRTSSTRSRRSRSIRSGASTPQPPSRTPSYCAPASQTPSRAPSYHAHPTSLPFRHGTGAHLAADASSLDDFSYGATTEPTPLANMPLIPSPATEPRHMQFRNKLMALSETPLKWENPGLLDEAMRAIPLERIYGEAEDEAALLEGEAISMDRKPLWAYQDCVIRALLKWFHNEFFTWVNNPACSVCGGPTVGVGHGAPSDEEVALSAQKVELYKCNSPACGSYERFPRYTDAFVLMQTRKGRCGEWANCFTMLCRSMGQRVRWVWNSEDRVWTEVYSEYRKRWIHIDSPEGAFDRPMMYTRGWGKKLGYCIAFGADGAMDVTGRYCRNPNKYGVTRDLCPEPVLLFIIEEIRRLRRRDRNKDDKFRLEGEDMRETHELRHYYVAAFVEELASMVPGSKKEAMRRQRRAAAGADAQKAAELRQQAGDLTGTQDNVEDAQTMDEDAAR